MKEEKSTTGGATPRRTLRTWKTNVHTNKAVIRNVPRNASNAAPLSVMVGGSATRVYQRADLNRIRWPLIPAVRLPGEEGTFNMCSFWLVEALTRAGLAFPEKLDQARLLFERVLGYANHLGLYSEQTGPQGEALGNFPQAFTRLALISAAFNLDRTLGSWNGTRQVLP